MTLRQPCTSSKTTRVFCGFKKLFVLFVFIKVEISSVFAAAFSKFFQNPSLTHLAHAFQNQRLAIGRILPAQQFLQNQSFHICTPSHNYNKFCAFLSHFYYMRISEEYKWNHKIIYILERYNHIIIDNFEKFRSLSKRRSA